MRPLYNYEVFEILAYKKQASRREQPSWADTESYPVGLHCNNDQPDNAATVYSTSYTLQINNYLNHSDINERHFVTCQF